MGTKNHSSVVRSIIAGALTRLFVRIAPRAAVAMTAAGGGVGYQSQFIDLTEPAMGVEVSDIALEAIDEYEQATPAGEITSQDIQLWDATSESGDFGVFPIRPISKITTLYIHHTAADTATPWGVIASIGRARGLGGMPYHFGIRRDGRIEILVPMEYRTNHTQGNNTSGVSAVLPGNYEKYAPNANQVAALGLLTRFMAMNNINDVSLHRDVRATACPGKYAAKALSSLRH